jgi:hypothetical protein
MVYTQRISFWLTITHTFTSSPIVTAVFVHGLQTPTGILLVPIGAAVIVASTIAFLIINYSQPASPEEDSDDVTQSENEDF